MTRWLREIAITVTASVFVAGPVAAIVLVAMPAAWHGPLVLWTVLIAALVGVAALRRIRRPPP